MVTVAELDRLDALVRRLTPLASVERGELIRAEDWNVVVGALLEALRAVLAGGRAETAPAHEHVDQVNVGWLDPRLRGLIERGPLAEPGAVARVDQLDRRIAKATDSLTRLESSVGEARSIASDLSVQDAKRASDLNAVRRTVEAIPDAREDVLGLRDSLRGIETGVRRAIEIGEGLEVNGERFDAAAFDGRLRGVEALSQRLTAPDGTLFDAAALERRLTGLVNTFVTRDDLDATIGGRRVELTPGQLATLEEGLTGRLQDRFTGQLTTSATTLRAEIATRLGEVDGLVARAIADAQPGIDERVLGTVRAEVAGRLVAGLAEIRTAIDAQVVAAEGRLTGTLDTRLAGLEDRVGGTILAQLDDRIAAAVEPIRTDVRRIDDRTRLNSDAITGIERDQASLATRVETVSRADEQGRRTLDAAIRSDLDAGLQAQSAAFDSQLAGIDGRIADRVAVAVRDASVSLSGQIDQLASAAARREAQLVANQMLGQIREIAREEATVALADVRRDIRTDLDANLERVSGLVTSEVRRQTANLPDLVRREVDTGRSVDVGRTLDVGGVRNIDTTRITPGGG